MTRFNVGGRVLKTALAVTLAIYLGQLLGLESLTPAAIVALLTVQRTFYHSLVGSLSKLGSVLLGGVLGTVFGYLFGVTPLAYGLVTLLAIFLCLQLHWHENIILTTVTAITVIFSGVEQLEIYSLLHIAAALLGALTALTVNYFFTPNHMNEVIKRLSETDAELRRLIRIIIREIEEPGWDDVDFNEEVSCLREQVGEGLNVAGMLREEKRFVINRETPSDRFRQAFHIFNSQLDRLEDMHNLARRIPIVVPQAELVVKLFRIVKKIQHNQLRGKRTAYSILDRVIDSLDHRLDEMELPQTREEFVSRASLFHLYQEIKRYYRRTQKLPPALLMEKKPSKKKKRKEGAGKVSEVK